MARTLKDLFEQDQFSVLGTASGRTTPDIGDNASQFGFSGGDPLGMGQQYTSGVVPYQNMGAQPPASMSGLSMGLMGEEAEPLFQTNRSPSGFSGEDDGGGMSGWEKAALATNIAGALGGIYGQYKEGRARDEELQRQREEHERQLREREASAKRLSPLLAGLLGKNRGAVQMGT